MASLSLKQLQQEHLSGIYPSTNGLKSHLFPHVCTLSTLKNKLLHEYSSLCLVRSHASNIAEKMTQREHNHVKKSGDHVALRETGFGFCTSTSTEEWVGRENKKHEVEDKGHGRTSKTRGSRNNGEIVSTGYPSMRSVNVRRDNISMRNNVDLVVENEMEDKNEKTKGGPLSEEKNKKKGKKAKVNAAEIELRIGLEMCSKRGDVVGAISLYDSAIREGIKLEQYHYDVLLYLCASASVGIVHPAKSGSCSSSSSSSSSAQEFAKAELKEVSSDYTESLGTKMIGEFQEPRSHLAVSNGSVHSGVSNGLVHLDEANGNISDHEKLSSRGLEVGGMVSFDETNLNSQLSIGFRNSDIVHSKSVEDSTVGMRGNESSSSTTRYSSKDYTSVVVSEDVKQYALAKGFEIYEKMCLEKISFSEAALTSVARMAMSMGNGDMAFAIVETINALGLTVRLRSYGPALFTFCNNGDIDKAFEVERHMVESGVNPEEPELEALLRVSVEAGRGEKVYYLLHKLRTSMRQVPARIAELIEKWFKSPVASSVGKRNWDEKLITQAMENGGGGWHGLGWLGKGKWSVNHTNVDADGVCENCSQKLVTIDIDPVETENFSRSVASIAGKRERNSNFQIFQKWLDYYGPFEAVIDAANVGLFSRRQFSLTKVNTIVNGIRQKLPSKKWPLIIVHNRRLHGGKMVEPTNTKLIEKWRNADALYATPTGSNDDWYWLYAAIKCKGLIITNDEMRDHIFQILGNDFIPKWKERHQVRFSFRDGSPEFQMPPPCSVVIQESEEGHWHIPIAAECEYERRQIWLCITRANSHLTRPRSLLLPKGSKTETHHQHKATNASSHAKAKKKTKHISSHQDHGGACTNIIHPSPKSTRYIPRTGPVTHTPKWHTIVSDIEAAEDLSGCVIDFQI